MSIFGKKAAQPQQPRPVKGAVNALPCPWCGTKMDLRELYKSNMLDQGSEIDCDKCGHITQIQQIVQTVVIGAIPSPNDDAIRAKNGRQRQSAAQPQSGAIIRRR